MPRLTQKLAWLKRFEYQSKGGEIINGTAKKQSKQVAGYYPFLKLIKIFNLKCYENGKWQIYSTVGTAIVWSSRVREHIVVRSSRKPCWNLEEEVKILKHQFSLQNNCTYMSCVTNKFYFFVNLPHQLGLH